MKQFNRYCNCLLFAVGCIYFASCYGPKKADVRETLDSAKATIEAEKAQLQLSVQKSQSAFSDERIDTTINNRIKERLAKYSYEIDSVNKEIAAIEQTLANAKAFRKEYEYTLIPKLASLEERKKENQLRLKRFTMMNEALDISRQNPFDLAAFFGSGKYNIPRENYGEAAELFLPAIDSLILFSNKYADIKRTSTLVVNGFADGQGIDSSSELSKTLLDYLNKNAADKKELNWALSELRSIEIAKLLEKLLYQKRPVFNSVEKINFDVYRYGQGETYPSKKITNYREDDERRRIVLIYWSVIPD